MYKQDTWLSALPAVEKHQQLCCSLFDNYCAELHSLHYILILAFKMRFLIMPVFALKLN